MSQVIERSWELQKKYTKGQLCAMARSVGLEANPLEQWRKDEIATAVAEQEAAGWPTRPPGGTPGILAP